MTGNGLYIPTIYDDLVGGLLLLDPHYHDFKEVNPLVDGLSLLDPHYHDFKEVIPW